MVNEFMSDISPSRNFSCRFLLFFFFLSFAKPAWSDVVKADDVSPSQWGKEWEKKQQPLISSNSNSAILSRCAIVQKKDESFSALPISPEDALKQSFLQIPDEKEVMLSKEVNKLSSNRGMSSVKAIHPCEKSLVSLAQCLRLDSLLDVSGPSWRLYRYLLPQKNLVLITEGPAGTPADYLTWIQTRLNYDGVVLDSKNEFLLTLLPKRQNQEEIQALTLLNSQDKVILSPASVKGTGLLQLHKSEGRFAIFRSVITKSSVGNTTSVPGTKIIIEKSKNN